ncbi:hypothetical protein BJX99DRAFT_269105 [Aspergillus californicus]
MAPSLRDLIDFLLAEIALCGSQGASPTDILSLIDTFYARIEKDASNRSHRVDRRFQEKVWQWLKRNPEVSVGKNREWNDLSLEDVEKRQDTKEEHGDPSRRSPIHVFVSEERTWLSITGHGPDETKVLPSEFVLLSIIASHKSSGVSQPELIRLSGQDKRSVPKRTDALQKKGYIEKRAIQVKAARTSLCTLRKFLNPDNLTAEKSAIGTSAAGPDTMIDFRWFTDTLFQIMREHKIIARTDLKELLGFSDRWRWRMLSRALRKFERIGVLKRVRAMSQYAKTMRKYHPCVMLLRDPSEKDVELFHDFSSQLYSEMGEDEDAEFEDDAEADDTTKEPSSTGNFGTVEGEKGVDMSGRILPLWSPDRNVHNQLFESVDRTGTDGATNINVIRSCLGVFYRRPLENTLSRLVECWQLSQPPHLRHLAIVRDTALRRTITHYVHYSTRHFGKLVDVGESSWEAVEFVPKNTKSDSVSVPPVDAKAQYDAYGLPIIPPGKELLKNGDSSLLDCMLVSKPRDYNVSSSDPSAVRARDGTYTINYGIRLTRTHAEQDVEASTGRRALKLEDEGLLRDVDADNTDVLYCRGSNKPKLETMNFSGMSEREKFEALGMDETWTEWMIHYMDRPITGVYVTARGRRRAVGQFRGRPRISRLVVFKSPKLLDLPWFREENFDSSNRAFLSPQPQDSSRGSLAPVRDSMDIDSAQGRGATRGTKRSSHGRSSGLEPTDMPQRASKSRRLGGVDGLEDPQEKSEHGTYEEALGTQADEASKASSSRTKRKRAASPGSEQQDTRVRNRGARGSTSLAKDVTQESGPRADRGNKSPLKRTRQKSAGPMGTEPSTPLVSREDIGQVIDKGQHNLENSLALTESIAPAETNLTPGNTSVNERIPEANTAAQGRAFGNAFITSASSMEPTTPGAPSNKPGLASMSATPEGSTVRSSRSKLYDQKGSVAFLRKKIVMEIVEKAGGAYSTGPELWYPFVTAWMKTRYKERPDIRTVRTAVKNLVDSGKLRQQTFCGKDRKGVMVTKTIVCKPELSPDDPFIKDMQEKVLDSEGGRYYFPPNVEVDISLTKQAQTPRGAKHNTEIPVEAGLTVKLHQKPALISAIERRKGESIQRTLLRRIDAQKMRESMQITRPSGAVRLLSIQRPGADAYGGTSMFGDDYAFTKARRNRAITTDPGSRRLKRSRLPISSMAPYAMLMNPRQSFNPGNGTFSTSAGLSTIIVARNDQPRTLPKPDPHLPQSLDDLITQAHTRYVGLSEETDPRSKNFFLDNDRILRWELKNEELFQQQRSKGLHYINQTIQDDFESAPIEGGIRFYDSENEREATSGPATRTRQQEPPSPPFVHEYPDFMGRQARFVSDVDRRSQRALSPPPINTVTPLYYQRRLPAPAAPQQRRIEKLNDMMAPAHDTTTAQSQKPLRRNRNFSQLSRSIFQKLVTAIVVVRSLAGGSDGRMVDWVLVSNCFPDQDTKTIIDKGKSYLSRNRLQVAKMQSDFHERFIDAYANDEVPEINYNDIEGYDWVAVIEWATVALDVPRFEKIPDLPATREQFDEIFELREEPQGSLDEFYQNPSITIYRKKALLSNVSYAIPLPSKTPTHLSQRQSELSHLKTVKTWIRANTLTPAEVYRSIDARHVLSTINDSLLNTALQSLVTERVISQSTKGRPVPGRNYDITDHFIFTLSKRRPIEIAELRRAAKFKTDTLDSALTRGGMHTVSYGAEDGKILALINLFAKGRIILSPRDPPRDKYGLTDGGYLTRMIDKDKLRFPVDIFPVPNQYITGNPTTEKYSTAITKPPCPPLIQISETLSVPEKFPLWVDIHGGFIQLLWDLALGAVITAVAARPGITAKGIAGMLKPTMDDWEVRLMLEWLVEVGVIHRTNKDDEASDPDEASWAVREWWWMVLV